MDTDLPSSDSVSMDSMPLSPRPGMPHMRVPARPRCATSSGVLGSVIVCRSVGASRSPTPHSSTTAGEMRLVPVVGAHADVPSPTRSSRMPVRPSIACGPREGDGVADDDAAHTGRGGG
jgi:hypothetical protein